MSVSVIVPYYNAEKWLGRCCESLTRQEGDFEFLLVSDHCTDNSDDVARNYACKDQRFTVIWNDGKGVSSARNTGLDNAKGDWITFLDADDEMLEGAYEKFAGGAKSNINQFNHWRYYAQHDTLRLRYTNRAGWYDISSLPQMWFGVWNKLFKADFVEDIRFDERLQYGEDGLFVLTCLAKDKLIYHAGRNVTTVVHNFDNPESLTKRKTSADLIGQIHIYEEFMHQQKDPDIKVAVCKELARLWDNQNLENLIKKEAFD